MTSGIDAIYIPTLIDGLVLTLAYISMGDQSVNLVYINI